ncbi:uncharacterized protein LY79DRAFT_575178 [Colletotrichum navitas]|uniref:Uncharacterized protein n=1 Tax=Colletotrichum navitas TaxID=681940 RepID=A0AAD8VAQ5_9PEZI|nr:uncharacterized protein LY79DRAFT_575178 [Colletotrichum navitas]KAK1599494.1 hypothetical protein LY79DRAFT_575178 [Colletotrichum navitas]
MPAVPIIQVIRFHDNTIRQSVRYPESRRLSEHWASRVRHTIWRRLLRTAHHLHTKPATQPPLAKTSLLVTALQIKISDETELNGRPCSYINRYRSTQFTVLERAHGVRLGAVPASAAARLGESQGSLEKAGSTCGSSKLDTRDSDRLRPRMKPDTGNVTPRTMQFVVVVLPTSSASLRNSELV